jgi:uncharacterized membrane protein YfcA
MLLFYFMLLEVIVFILAGFATGLVTGFVGASAAVAFIPLILIFFNYNTFTLIGMSLVLDMFIAFPAFLNYLKHKNVNLKAGIYLALPAMLGAVIGSYFSTKIPDTNLLGFTSLFAAFAGVTIFRRKPAEKKSGSFSKDLSSRDWKFWASLFFSFVVGFLGGTMGAAGGVTMLFLLIFIFGFEVHEAVGTSVFIMLFIAIFGAATHFYYLDKMHFSWLLLLLASVGGFVGSLFSSRVANLIPERILNKTVGIILFVLGMITFAHKVLF